VLQCTTVWLRRAAVCCSVLQCVAVCCSMLQYVAVCCSVPPCGCVVLQYAAVWCSVVQRGTARSVLQCCAVMVVHCGAVWCNVVQCVAVYCRVLRVYSAVCYSVVQQDTHRVRNALVTSLSHKRTILPHSHQSSRGTSCLLRTRNRPPPFAYGVATISTLLKIIGLFCKRAL